MPSLTFLAGPNGAGKTRFSQYLYEQKILTVEPINLDMLELEAVNELQYDSYFHSKIAKNSEKIFKKY